MLTSEQALKILREDKDYEEKIFKTLAGISMMDLENNELLEDKDKNEIKEILKTMSKETEHHAEVLDILIKYVENSGKDGF